MAKKPASLEAALSGQAEHEQPAAGQAEVVQHPSSRAATKPAEEKLTVYVPAAAKKRLKLMCIEHDRDINSYLREGLDLVLAKYGQASLAEFAKK